MAEVLLKELSNSDIDWLLATGRREEIAAGTVLLRQGEPVDAGACHLLRRKMRIKETDS
ncbi:cyclic nucleotide-binding protein [Leptolyngbya sp. NIES-3755]|nr:cyclic nucleotide-binding protein [Leptolyngbya sp. NIES-3755]